MHPRTSSPLPQRVVAQTVLRAAIDSLTTLSLAAGETIDEVQLGLLEDAGAAFCDGRYSIAVNISMFVLTLVEGDGSKLCLELLLLIEQSFPPSRTSW